VAGGVGPAGAQPADQKVSLEAATYAALARYEFEPRRAGDVLDRWQNGVLAAARAWPGFVEGLLLMDRAAGRAIGMGLFASKATADAFGATPRYQAAIARLDEALTNPYVREEYEVHTS
jgi:hypothetical protein